MATGQAKRLPPIHPGEVLQDLLKEARLIANVLTLPPPVPAKIRRLSPLAPATLLLAAQLAAHPAIGIVMDSTGAVFYLDNVHVWRAAGNLYGEHLWHEGARTGRWGHRVWKPTPGGQVARRDSVAHKAGAMAPLECSTLWSPS